ncbi:MAG: hypothetical protein AAF125_19335, partial [Chloroflexota bacterium]
MTISVSWFEPDHIIEAVITEYYTIGDSEILDREVRSLLEDSSAQIVYLLVNAAGMSRIDVRFNDVFRPS